MFGHGTFCDGDVGVPDFIAREKPVITHRDTFTDELAQMGGEDVKVFGVRGVF